MTAIRTSIQVLAWMMIIALSVVIVWTFLQPWTADQPSENEIPGRWIARPVPGQEVHIVLSDDHTFSSPDWPGEIGCDGPPMLGTRTAENGPVG